MDTHPYVPLQSHRAVVNNSSASCRIGVGSQQVHKAFMVRTIRPLDSPYPGLKRAPNANRFSLHAATACIAQPGSIMPRMV